MVQNIIDVNEKVDRILNIEAEMERESHIYQGAIIREN